MVIKLEDRMVRAHKIGVAAYEKFGDIAAPHLKDCVKAHPHIFTTAAEGMAFLAGYYGAQRRNGRMGYG